MRIPKIKNIWGAALLSSIAGIVVLLLFIVIIQLLTGGPEQTEVARNSAYTILHPSLGKAASLGNNFFNYFLSWIGASILAFSFVSDRTGYTIGRTDNAVTTIGIIEFLLGAIIMVASYLTPAYRTKQYTTYTVEKGQEKTIKDRDFKEPFTDYNYDLYLKANEIEKP